MTFMSGIPWLSVSGSWISDVCYSLIPNLVNIAAFSDNHAKLGCKLLIIDKMQAAIEYKVYYMV